MNYWMVNDNVTPTEIDITIQRGSESIPSVEGNPI